MKTPLSIVFGAKKNLNYVIMTQAQFNKLKKLLKKLNSVQFELYHFPWTEKKYTDKIEEAAFNLEDPINLLELLLDSVNTEVYCHPASKN